MKCYFQCRRPVSPPKKTNPFVAGIPKVYWFGKERRNNILIMELLEKNLEQTNSTYQGKLSLMTILLIVE